MKTQFCDVKASPSLAFNKQQLTTLRREKATFEAAILNGKNADAINVYNNEPESSQRLVNLQTELTTTLRTISDATDKRLLQMERIDLSLDEAFSLKSSTLNRLVTDRAHEHDILTSIAEEFTKRTNHEKTMILNLIDGKMAKLKVLMDKFESSLEGFTAVLKKESSDRVCSFDAGFGDLEDKIKSLSQSVAKATNERLQVEDKFHRTLAGLEHNFTEKIKKMGKERDRDFSGISTDSATKMAINQQNSDKTKKSILNSLLSLNDAIVTEFNNRVTNGSQTLSITEGFLKNMEISTQSDSLKSKEFNNHL